jgi:hypothetical protein
MIQVFKRSGREYKSRCALKLKMELCFLKYLAKSSFMNYTLSIGIGGVCVCV